MGRYVQDGIIKKPVMGLIPSMFLLTSLSMILTELAGVISGIVDGVITSRFLGEYAYSAISLLGPFVGILLVIATFFSTGCQITCSAHLGKGEKDKANEVFSATCFIVLVISAVLVALCVFAPRVLISVSGVSMNRKPELYPLMYRYLEGYLYGIPGLMIIQLISPVVIMDGSGRLLTISSVILFGANIIGDFLCIHVFRSGVFGIGLSTAIAFYVQLLVLLTHFFRKKGTFRLTVRVSQLFHLGDVVKSGYPSLVRKAASVLRDLIINRFNLVIALTTAAVAAKGMQNDLNLLMFCLATGVSRTLLTMSGVYYSAEDLAGLKRLFSFAMRFGVILSAIAGVILALLAPSIANYYTDDPEVISLAVFSIRCLAVSLVFDMISASYQYYLQGVQQRKGVNIMAIGERFALPVVLALAFGALFGSKGILASVAAGKILLVIGLYVFVWIKCKRFPRHWEDFMFLPEGFGGSEHDNIYERITAIEEVVPLSERAHAFCTEHGIEERSAKLISLFTEEMASNVILHGRKRKFGLYGVDYRLAVNDEKISITFRDLCKAFDPFKWRELHSTPGTSEAVGIRLVLGLAEDIRYFNAFQSNNVILYLKNRVADSEAAQPEPG